MRIVCISDTHSLHNDMKHELPQGDVLIHVSYHYVNYVYKIYKLFSFYKSNIKLILILFSELL